MSTRRRPPRPDHRRNGSDGRYRVRLPPAHAASGTSVPAAPPTRLSASAELCLCRADAGCPASARRGASGPRADGAAAAAALKVGAPQVPHAFACPCLLCMPVTIMPTFAHPHTCTPTHPHVPPFQPSFLPPPPPTLQVCSNTCGGSSRGVVMEGGDDVGSVWRGALGRAQHQQSAHP